MDGGCQCGDELASAVSGLPPQWFASEVPPSGSLPPSGSMQVPMVNAQGGQCSMGGASGSMPHPFSMGDHGGCQFAAELGSLPPQSGGLPPKKKQVRPPKFPPPAYLRAKSGYQNIPPARPSQAPELRQAPPLLITKSPGMRQSPPLLRPPGMPAMVPTANKRQQVRSLQARAPFKKVKYEAVSDDGGSDAVVSVVSDADDVAACDELLAADQPLADDWAEDDVAACDEHLAADRYQPADEWVERAMVAALSAADDAVTPLADADRDTISQCSFVRNYGRYNACTNVASKKCINGLCRKHCNRLVLVLWEGGPADVVHCDHCAADRPSDWLPRCQRAGRRPGPNYSGRRW